MVAKIRNNTANFRDRLAGVAFLILYEVYMECTHTKEKRGYLPLTYIAIFTYKHTQNKYTQF